MGHGYSPAPPRPPGGLLDDVRSCCKVPQDFSFFVPSSASLFFSPQLDTFSLSVYLSARAFLLWPSPTATAASSVCLDEFLQDAGTQTFLTRCTCTGATFLLDFSFLLILLSLSHMRLWKIQGAKFGLIYDLYLDKRFIYCSRHNPYLMCIYAVQ